MPMNRLPWERLVLHRPAEILELTLPMQELLNMNPAFDFSEEPPNDDTDLLKWCAANGIPKKDRFRAIVIVTAIAFHMLGNWEEIIYVINISYANLTFVLEEYIGCLGFCISETLADLRAHMQQALAPLTVNKKWRNKRKLLETWIMDSETELYVRCCNIVKAIVGAGKKRQAWLLYSKTHFTMQRCMCCGRLLGITPESQGYRCGNCKGVLYCNRECQRKDWPSHRKYCEEIKQHMKNFPSQQGAQSMTKKVRQEAQAYSSIPEEDAKIFADAYELAKKNVARDTIHWNVSSVEIRKRLGNHTTYATTKEKPAPANPIDIVKLFR